MTDHGNVSGAIAFSDALSKKGLTPIIGCEFYVCARPPSERGETNRHLSHLLLLARNLEGWKELIQITSQGNDPDHFYYKPRLDLATLASLPHDNIIAITGHYGSTFTKQFFSDPRIAGTARTEKEAKRFMRSDMDECVRAHMNLLKEIFGDQLFIEIQMVDSASNKAAQIQAKGLRHYAAQLGLPTVATPDAHYAEQDDAALQRILLCTSLGNTTLAEVRQKLSLKENVPLAAFFNTSTYHIPSYQEMLEYGNTDAELQMTLEVANMCEPYKLTGTPMLPKFPCPSGMSSMEYIRKLCREGWLAREHEFRRVIKSGKCDQIDYTNRFEKEYKVLEEAGLGDYFLIVQDFVKYAQRKDILIGAGRGSAAGSLILHLLGVTHVDPLEYDLLFERFYNAGRNTATRVSLPDVDMDFEKERRGDIIQYVKDTFGEDRVSQMLTFNRMQGRSAFKDVARARNACGFAEMNRITEWIPGSEEIADQLQDMREADKQAGGDGEASIIRWSLENHSEELEEWAYIDSEGEIQGEYATVFKQAIAIEGTKRSMGKHPAGIVISSEPLASVCPMAYDAKEKSLVAGMEMNDLEAAGHVKFDIMGVAVLDKVHGVQNLLSTGTL
jgi:DNA polymerase-3 subunit alpha